MSLLDDDLEPVVTTPQEARVELLAALRALEPYFPHIVEHGGRSAVRRAARALAKGQAAVVPKAYKTKEAAEVLGVSPHTVYQLVQMGVIPSFRPTGPKGNFAIGEDDLLKYRESCRRHFRMLANASLEHGRQVAYMDEQNRYWREERKAYRLMRQQAKASREMAVAS